MATRFWRNAPGLGDLDLLVAPAPRESSRGRQEALETRRRMRAGEGGRRFGTLVDELTWPQREVQILLKNRSGSLSLHSTDHALVLKTKHRIVLKDRRTRWPAPGAG